MNFRTDEDGAERERERERERMRDGNGAGKRGRMTRGHEKERRLRGTRRKVL